MLVYAYCLLPSLKSIVVGFALLWLLLAVLVVLSAYSNAQQGRPAIGAGEAQMLTVLVLIAIALFVGWHLEALRGISCSI